MPVDTGLPVQSSVEDATWVEPGDDVRIPAPLGRNSSDTGIALDPAHKEVIIATAAGNTIMTFSIPEVFDRPTTTSSR